MRNPYKIREDESDLSNVLKAFLMPGYALTSVYQLKKRIDPDNKKEPMWKTVRTGIIVEGIKLVIYASLFYNTKEFIEKYVL